ncbi:MAG: catechol-2,3-dioxygenase, partial [Glaciecola sp.]
MKFRKLSLYTNNLESEFQFYANTLGFEVVESGPTRFSVKVGWSQLSFAKSESEHKYHYCFLIPSNQLDQALDWVEKRTEVIIIEKNKKIQNFKTWNADSFYFNDASGNLAEFIVRHDLNNSNSSSFDLPMALGINEIGMPTTDISNTNNQLVTEIDSKFWKGDYERFGTNG